MAETYLERAHLELQIESWSNAAREILLRGNASGGAFAETHTTNADRSRATNTYQIHGAPEALTASPAVAGVRRGECYVRITLLADGEPVKRLVAAYLTDGKTLSWPDGVHEDFTEGAGLIRIVTGTNPAAGAEISEAVPANARWKLKGLIASLVSDATVLNRKVRFEVDDGTNVIFPTITGPNHAASSTFVYVPTAGYPVEQAAIHGANYYIFPLPMDLVLFQGYQIYTVTANIQAGDDWGAPRILVEEWIEE